MNTKAFIFDLDGVIVDTAKFHFEAWKILSDKLGLQFSHEVNERLKGVSRMRSFEIILEVNDALDRYTEEEKTAYITEKNDIYVELIKTLTPDDILPGIKTMVEKARANGIKTAVASVSKNAPAVLTALELIDSFDYVADAAKVSKSKPDPEIFLVCANALGVDPALCVGIEDAQAGIEAIKAAGMYAVGINIAVTSVEPDMHLGATSELDFDKLCAIL